MAIEQVIKAHQASTLAGLSDQQQGTELMDRTQRIAQLANRVRERLLQREALAELASVTARDKTREKIWHLLEEEAEGEYASLFLSSFEKAELLQKILLTMFGFGIIEPFLKDSTVTEIMINGPQTIFIEQRGELRQALDRRGEPLQFASPSELLYLIEKIVAPLNRRVDESNPIVDGRLPDGSRVNIVLSPVSLDGPAVTIRKFPAAPYSLDHLVSAGTLAPQVADLLRWMVRAKYNIGVSGGTSTGKTTFLNALSLEIRPLERIVTVEDAAELRLAHARNLIRLEARPANLEGKGHIAIRDLVRTALRMRPDRIIVGEVRGGEALDMLQAMNTGHDGSLTTAHANSAHDLIGRLETMVLMAGMELPASAIRRQIVGAVDFIIHLARLSDGTRRIVQISEVRDLQAGEVVLADLYTWKNGPPGTLDPGHLVATDEQITRTGKSERARLPVPQLGRDLPCPS